MHPKLFPTIMFILSIAASLNYFTCVFILKNVPIEDWRKALYWAAAAAITYSVTY